MPGRPPPSHLTGHHCPITRLKLIRDPSVATSRRATERAVAIAFFRVSPHATEDPHLPAALQSFGAEMRHAQHFGRFPSARRLVPAPIPPASERRALHVPFLCQGFLSHRIFFFPRLCVNLKSGRVRPFHTEKNFMITLFDPPLSRIKRRGHPFLPPLRLDFETIFIKMTTDQQPLCCSG